MATVNAYTDNGRIRVRTPDGSLAWAPAERIGEAVLAGYRPVTPDEHYDAERLAEAGESPTLAFAESALDAATFGAAPVLERALGVDPRDIAARREANPIASTAGTVAGAVGTAFIPGAPVATVGRAAAAVGGRAAARIAGESIGRRLAAKVVSSGVSGALQGAAFGAGEAVSDLAVRDDVGVVDAASSIAEAAGVGAAFGAVADVGLAGVGGAVRLAGKGLARLAAAGAAPSKAARAASTLLGEIDKGDLALAAGDIVRLHRLDYQLGAAIGSMRRKAADGGAAADDLAELVFAQRQVRDRIKSVAEESKQQYAKVKVEYKSGEKRRVSGKASSSAELDAEARARRAGGFDESFEARGGSSAAADDAAFRDVDQGDMLDFYERISRGERLSNDEQYAALWGARRNIVDRYRDVVELNRELRLGHWRTVRRILRNGGPDLSAAHRTRAADIDNLQRSLKARMDDLEREMRSIRRSKFREQALAVFDSQGAGPAGGESAWSYSARKVSAEADDLAAKIKLKEAREAAKQVETFENVKISAEYKAALKDLSQHQEPFLERLMNSSLAGVRGAAEETTAGWGARYASWFSAPTILGWAIGNAPGAMVGALMTNPLARDIAARALSTTWRGLVATTPVLATGIKIGAAKLGADGLAEARSQMNDPVNAPDLIFADASEAYLEAGMPQDAAVRLAQFQAARMALLRDALPPGNSQAEVQRYERIWNAARAPREITRRIEDGESTPEDVRVLERLAPEMHAQLRRAALDVLRASRPGQLAPRIEWQLRLWAGQQDVNHMRAATIQQILTAPPRGQQPSSRAAISFPSPTSPLAAAASTLRG